MMNNAYVVLDPGNKMVFECSLDDLMEQVERQQLVNVSARELRSKRLQGQICPGSWVNLVM